MGIATVLISRPMLLFSLAVMAVLAVSELIWFPLSQVDVDASAMMGYAVIAAPLVCLWLVSVIAILWLRRSKLTVPGLVGPVLSRTHLLLLSLVLKTVMVVEITLFSYLATATTRPLIDADLAAIDARLGFIWTEWAATLNANTIVSAALAGAYASIGPQLILIPVLLVFVRNERLFQFVALFGIAGLLTVTAMFFMPTAGAFDYFKPASDILNQFNSADGGGHLTQFRALRSMQPFRISVLAGIVTFPSFHAALGLLFIYITRGIRFAAPIFLILNLSMIISTVPVGGHYLTDVIAGIVVALAAISVVRRAADKSPIKPALANPGLHV